MSEFARGSLVGRALIAAPGVVVVYTATVQTEIMAVYAPAIYTAGDPTISLYHEMEGGTVYDLSTAIVYQRTLSAYDDAVLLIAQCIGGGIHLERGQSIAAELHGPAGAEVNVSLYGITSTLQQVR